MSRNLPKSTPKSVLDYIDQLERRVAAAEKALHDEHRGSSGTAFLEVWNSDTSKHDRVPLCSDRVVFKVGTDLIEARVRSGKHGDGRLDVRSYNGGLAMYPECGNVISIEGRDR